MSPHSFEHVIFGHFHKKGRHLHITEETRNEAQTVVSAHVPAGRYGDLKMATDVLPAAQALGRDVQKHAWRASAQSWL